MLELPSLPLRAGHLTVSDLIDLYMAHYAGRDTTRQQRLGWWQAKVGSVALQDLTDDQVHAGAPVSRAVPVSLTGAGVVAHGAAHTLRSQPLLQPVPSQ